MVVNFVFKETIIPSQRSRSRGRKRCPDLSCTCVGTKGCEQQGLGRGEDCGIIGGEKDGGQVEEEENSENSPDATENTGDTDNEEEVSKEVAEENNNEEDKGEEELAVGSNLMPKEMMMSFHPSMEDLVEMIEESGVMEDKELAAQLHFVVSYFIRVTSKQMKK